MKILVTGAKGQLGHKINELLGKEHELILTDVETMDITNPEMVSNVMDRERPDVVIHGAAYTRVDAAEENEELCQRINVAGTENVARAADAAGAILVYISTDYVFDGKKTEPYTEMDEALPLSVYGRTKLLGEEAVKKNCEKHYILRIAWLFGELPENYPGTNFVETMLKLAKERDSLSIVNDQVGSPTYTKDLVEVFNKIITQISNFKSQNSGNGSVVGEPLQIPFGTYHFSGKNPCSWYDFAKEVFLKSGIEIDLKPIMSAEYPQKAKRPGYSYMDKSKIENAVGMTVRSWQEMLSEYLDKKKS